MGITDRKLIEEMHRWRELIILSVGLALLTFVTSCKPLSEIGNKNTNIVTISKDEFNKLNGTYSNNFDTTFGKVTHSPYDGGSGDKRLTILNQLFNNYPESAWRNENGKMIDPKEKWIKIEFNSKKTATVSMYHNKRFVFSKSIHGKFKNGCFYLRPKIWVIPLVPLVFGYNFERARLGKTINDDLIIDYRVNRWGFALVGGSADKGFASSIHGKEK